MLQRHEEAAQSTVKVYLRNQQKIAKIMTFPALMPARELYRQSSINYNVPVEDIHLYYAGNPINPEDEVPLENNSIIHIVNLPRLKIATLTLIIKRIPSDQPSMQLQTFKTTKIKDFIDGLLCQVIWKDSKQIFLVHMGRQLDIQKTFQEEEVESNSELICMNFQEEKEEEEDDESATKNINNHTGGDSNIMINLRETNHSHKSKQIYPSPDFLVEYPQEVESTNRLNLIFDSKVRRSSSIQGIDFEPRDIIEEETDLQLIARTSYQSEHYSEHNSNRQHFSMMNDQTSGVKEGDSHLRNNKNEGLQEHKHDHVQAGDLIYSGEAGGVSSRGLMKDLINEYRQKVRKESQKEEEEASDE